MSTVTWALRDSWTEAMRHLRIIPRNVELLIFATIQPIMFVVLFVYVFGGSIDVAGFASYDQFLIPGIFSQSLVFGSAFTGIGIAEDLSKGLVDRLRSLPMSRSAVLIGRTVSDLVRNIITFTVMLVVSIWPIGFRFEGSTLEAILDEATASVDTRTELVIQEALKKLLAGRTSFVIAHRLSTIRDATQVLVLENGQIVEQGTHDALVAAEGAYAKLHARQFRDVAVADNG